MEIEPQLASLENFIARRIGGSFENKKIQLHFAGTNPFYVPSALVLTKTKTGFKIEKFQREPIIIAEHRGSKRIYSRVPNCNFDLIVEYYLETVVKIEPAQINIDLKFKYILETTRYYYGKRPSIYEFLRNAD